ncbi:30S ribosomal protein S21, chloroplastic-like [Abrus precatorius]|uniref:30S ribosomal protein S21, chloroplastic-like n=1 Tax=Abrus precatorius TaxID=3816 RepID=A0A8B8K1X7_ABRPR|nr:30S ribosomal protein S21, chloroplastic-like [Abrus precatorius]
MAVSTIFLSLTLPCSHLRLPKTSSRTRWSSAVTAAASAPLRATASNSDASMIGMLYPALAYSTILYFKSTYNVQIVVHDDEPEDKLINRFRKEVLKAGVLQECRRRRFFENKHDKIKRKTREASRRNRKRKPRSRALAEKKLESVAKKKDDEDDDIDNWELPDVDIPYL